MFLLFRSIHLCYSSLRLILNLRESGKANRFLVGSNQHSSRDAGEVCLVADSTIGLGEQGVTLEMMQFRSNPRSNELCVHEEICIEPSHLSEASANVSFGEESYQPKKKDWLDEWASV